MTYDEGIADDDDVDEHFLAAPGNAQLGEEGAIHWKPRLKVNRFPSPKSDGERPEVAQPKCPVMIAAALNGNSEFADLFEQICFEQHYTRHAVAGSTRDTRCAWAANAVGVAYQKDPTWCWEQR